MGQKRRRLFDQEFERKAVRQAGESGEPPAQIARELGIGDGLLRKWLEQYDEAKVRGLTPEQFKAEHEELRRRHADVKRQSISSGRDVSAVASMAQRLLRGY